MDNLLAQYDCVLVNDLTIPMSIGIYDHEKQTRQNVIINIKAYVTKAKDVTNISEVASYEDMVNHVLGLSRSRHYDLVETFCEEIATIILAFKTVNAVQIRVEKPDIIKETKSVGVEILRFKETKH